MKKIICILLAIVAQLSFLTVFAENENSEITVLLNGSVLEFDQKPIIQDGRTLVPMRAIFEAMKCDVKWGGVA
ncbi:MAG: hypothetical protein IJ366_09550 [Clostridia bacterium]|nr:hypothetical protein [Clostridia bacterium]